MPNLNLGCGRDYREKKDWINYDISPICDVVGDWTDGLPFKEKSFDAVFAAHVLEHVVNLRALKAELARILQPGGQLEVIVPNYLSIDAWGDDTHVRAFSVHSFQKVYWSGFEPVRIARIHCEPPPWYKPDTEDQEQTTWLQVLFQRDYQPYNIIKKQYQHKVNAGGMGGLT